MHITRDAILDLLRERGDEGVVARAERDLPDPLVFARDRDAIRTLGLDPAELVQRFDGAGIPGLS